MSRLFSLKVVVALGCAVVALLAFRAGQAADAPAPPANQEELARHLATQFRSARAVISDSQTLINDAAKGDKELTGDKVVELTKGKYREATGRDLATLDPASREGQLTQAMFASIQEVMEQAQPLINKKGLAFKGFLPAVFAKQIADDFSRDTGRFAFIKLTAPRAYIRNRGNTPDAWENAVIETKFKAKSWKTGQSFGEPGEHKGKAAFRLMIPEYYAESCLQCHGDPKGQRDISGGKKEGGKLGDLGGAISVVIYGM